MSSDNLFAYHCTPTCDSEITKANPKLTDCRFQTDTPNVVHMTVKPQEAVDEEENAKSGKGGSRRDGDEEQTAGCRCVIL